MDAWLLALVGLEFPPDFYPAPPPHIHPIHSHFTIILITCIHGEKHLRKECSDEIKLSSLSNNLSHSSQPAVLSELSSIRNPFHIRLLTYSFMSLSTARAAEAASSRLVPRTRTGCQVYYHPIRVLQVSVENSKHPCTTHPCLQSTDYLRRVVGLGISSVNAGLCSRLTATD